MKTFTGKHSLSDIKSKVLELGGAWNQEKYEQGSDWVDFHFTKFHGRKELSVMLSPFNGRFMVLQDGEKIITESSDHLDGTKWYDELLNLIYKTEEKAND